MKSYQYYMKSYQYLLQSDLTQKLDGHKIK